MNYFAHGHRYIDRPYFLAGTATPDWLSAIDRKVRMRSKRVEPFADGSGTPEAEFAAGVLQHLWDDRWFHQSPAFLQTCSDLTVEFRNLLGRDDGFRPGFLGHIVTEMLLDAVLIHENPERLDAYYRAMAELDFQRIEETVNRMAKFSTNRLADFLPRFVESRFLEDYPDSKQLLFRLNQVLRRIKLKPLPDPARQVLEIGWEIVRPRTGALLPDQNPVP